VTIQKDGQLTEHIKNISQKCNRLLGFLMRNKKNGSKTIKEQAYKMLLRPCLEYACTVWDPYTQTDSYKIEHAEYWTSSVGDLLDSLQWPTLADRRRRAHSVMLYKVLDKSVAMSFGTDLQSTPQCPRRGASKVPNDRQLVRQFSANDYRTALWHKSIYPGQ